MLVISSRQVLVRTFSVLVKPSTLKHFSVGYFIASLSSALNGTSVLPYR